MQTTWGASIFYVRLGLQGDPLSTGRPIDRRFCGGPE